MTRIDFHTNVADKIAYACRLVRKAHQARNQIVLMTQDAAQCALLDQALWTFSAPDFLPHVLAGTSLAAETPIILTASDADRLPHFDILVNLSNRTPGVFSRFQRLFEIISQDPDDAAAGRKRYTEYKQQNYQPSHFIAGKT
ncbi:MAG: DNA polymerase-3 subunit chi [Janthinobacterium sp.]|jgi:DNA polymerase-3 subunit chi